jgi:glycerol-3-phosphate dehydrogenase subunit B
MRLHHILVQAIEDLGGRVYNGMQAVGAAAAGEHVTAVYTEAGARRLAHRHDQYVLATGGILGGGIATNHQGDIREAVFGLPVNGPAKHLEWFARSFFDSGGHPIYCAGLDVDDHFRPLNGNRQPLYDNLFAAGSTLAHGDYIRERSLEGVALATGYVVGEEV